MKNLTPAVPTFVRLSPSRGTLRWPAFFAALTLPFAGGLLADPLPTTLRIAPLGTGLEGFKNFALEWNAVPNATYLLEKSGTLGSGSPWQLLDAVRPPDVLGSYQLSVPATDTSGFYRLVLPKPIISSVEPTVFPSGAATTIYLVGQCFDSNDVVRVDGIDVGGVVFVNSGLLQFTLPPQSAGTHLVELVRAGVVRSSFTVTCADAFLNPELVLQGPPEVPLASAQALYASKKGYDYYQAHSQLNSARLNNNPAFQESKHQGTMQRAAFLSKKGYDYYQANSGVARSIQSEVKANLKAAYNRSLPGGSDDDCDDEDSPSSLTAAQCDYFAEGNKINICHRTGSTKNPYTIVRTNSAGCAVMPFSGEVRQCDVDLLTPGRGLDFVWGRTYNSRIGRIGASVNGWTFSYDVKIQSLGGNIVVRNGTGRADTFKPNASGVYTCPEFFSEGTLGNNVFKLTFADTGYWEFKPITTSPDAGKLAKMVDRNGNTITLKYDISGRLAQIVDDLGRTNTVAYNSAGQLASITDFSGRTVAYEYYQGLPKEPGGAGDLKSVTLPPVIGTHNGNDFPAGKTVTYTYSTGYADDRENHLLLSVIDAKGQIQQRHVYQHNQTDLEFLRCISVQHWTNTPTMISYLPQTPTPANQFATLRCVINNPVGDVTECYFDARNRPVKLQEFTGRATPDVQVTATENRPAGKVRPSDPDLYETRCSWNNDSLCTLEIGPGGQQTQCVYESDFAPGTRARKRADCRVVRERASSAVDSDGDGAADLTERVWYYAYDPRFGSDPSARPGKKIYVGNLPYSASERGPRYEELNQCPQHFEKFLQFALKCHKCLLYYHLSS